LDSSILKRCEGGELSQEKDRPGESIEKEIVKRMEKFPKCSLFKYRQCVEKVKE